MVGPLECSGPELGEKLFIAEKCEFFTILYYGDRIM
jgi:hypothetical protein